jgi:hypothetical protein
VGPLKGIVAFQLITTSTVFFMRWFQTASLHQTLSSLLTGGVRRIGGTGESAGIRPEIAHKQKSNKDRDLYAHLTLPPPRLVEAF